MKKNISIKSLALAAALCMGAGSLYAQTVNDALTFSTHNYYGTARSIAMGNAFTALGGDLGSININPAGSAVNNFSQITLTPALTLTPTESAYCAEPTLNQTFINTKHNNSTRFTIPNFGAILNYNTKNKTGIKSFSFGIVANITNNFASNMSAEGINKETTFAGSLAARSTGLPFGGLNASDAYDRYDWLSVVGLKSGMISNYGEGDADYIGVTERLYEDNTIQLADAITQQYGRMSSGTKYDMVFNFGMNISDFLYLGANVGLVTMNYSMNQYFKEYAGSPSNFGIEYDNGNGGVDVAYFDALRYRYAYDATGSGVYAKIGAIVTPMPGLRLGAAIQTPTSTTIKEHWQHAGDTYYTDSNFNTSAESPRGEYQYRFVSPYRFSLGAAYTFGSVGLLSIDYEMCNYSSMGFREIGTFDHSAFEAVNNDISKQTGVSHSIRIGGEIKVTPAFAVRAGYNTDTPAHRNINKYGEISIPKNACTQVVSFGLGYSSKGSFFADFAIRYSEKATEYITPYEDYIFDDGNNIISLTPELKTRLSLVDAVLTFGFRF